MVNPGYPIYYIQVLKVLDKKGSATRSEIRAELQLPYNRLYRAIYRLYMDGLIDREIANGKEIIKITEKGREYLMSVKKLMEE